MRYSNLLLATLLALPQSYAQQAPDGKLVPYTSVLPVCASLCGPLFDVEGGCSDKTCFCADARLQPMKQSGTASVSSICGPASCTSAADLTSIKNWYTSFCGSAAAANPTTKTAGAAATSGSSSGSQANSSGGGGDNSWLATHTRWVIMIVVVVIGLALLWVGAWFFRRRYLRKKEREIEMSPPVAWGPSQMSNHPYGDGVTDANGATAPGAAGGHHKEMSSALPVSGKRLSKSKMGWFKANK